MGSPCPGRWIAVAFAAWGAAHGAGAQTVDDCGGLTNHYGPFDYRTATNRGIVEDVHFTTKVESLRGGNTSITPGGDINYTLRVFPNHHRALMAVTRLSEKEKRDPPRDVEFSVRCWYERAEAFKPDDGMVKALYGTYLVRAGMPQEGVAKLESALAIAGDNASIYYNLGLAFFDLKNYDQAVQAAQRAYALGFPLPGVAQQANAGWQVARGAAFDDDPRRRSWLDEVAASRVDRIAWTSDPRFAVSG